MNLSDLRSYWSLANVQAMARLVRERESNQSAEAYTVINGGAHFTPPADYSQWRHPWHGIPTTQGARASGAYQHLGTTWKSLADRYGIPDFSPPSQDAGFVGGLVDRGALEDVIAGRIESAIAKLRKEWTSLPGAAESSGSWTMAKALAVYQKWGGALAPSRPGGAPTATPQQPVVAGQPIQPKETRPMAIPILATLAGPLLQAVIERFAPAPRAAVEAAQAKAPDDSAKQALSDGIMAILTRITGQIDPLQAAAAVTADTPDAKAKLAAVETNTLAYLDQIAPLLDKVAQYEQARWKAVDESADRAAARGQKDKVDIAPVLVSQSAWAFSVAAVAILVLLGVQTYFDTSHRPDPTLMGFLGILIYGVVRMMDRPSAYRFGGAFESDATATGNKAINQALDERRATGGKS